ncbi:unnamed protein product [Durusdinium trenchii]|uniref:Uncharacterized protein n=1 Tax=Durusdinium trenchii TaxID=1381693 RepID=A0ABP0IX43_9DINO
MMDMRSETKTDQATMADLADKDAAVTNAIALIQSKVAALLLFFRWTRFHPQCTNKKRRLLWSPL